jgi:hypothetical protein
MEDAEHADLGPEMTRIRGDLAQRCRTGLEEPRVQPRPVAIGQGQEIMWQREDGVHITARQAVPARARGASAHGPAPGTWGSADSGTSYRRWPDARRRHTDRRAHPERRCDSARSPEGPHGEPRMLRDEGVTLRVEDIGHLHGRPTHHCGRFRRRRERGRTTGAGTWSCSSGFGAACKCRRERCK